jgi:hypothetical protein
VQYLLFFLILPRRNAKKTKLRKITAVTVENTGITTTDEKRHESTNTIVASRSTDDEKPSKDTIALSAESVQQTSPRQQAFVA